MHVAASLPTTTSNVEDSCILEGQDFTLTCQVMYNGTNLMPLMMQWSRWTWNNQYQRLYSRGSGTSSTVNASSVYRSSYTFTATGQTANYYTCAVRFSRPTGKAISGVQRQSTNQPSYYVTSLLYRKKVASKGASFMLLLSVAL